MIWKENERSLRSSFRTVELIDRVRSRVHRRSTDREERYSFSKQQEAKVTSRQFKFSFQKKKMPAKSSKRIASARFLRDRPFLCQLGLCQSPYECWYFERPSFKFGPPTKTMQLLTILRMRCEPIARFSNRRTTYFGGDIGDVDGKRISTRRSFNVNGQ
jgi:hypothetical protein